MIKQKAFWGYLFFFIFMIQKIASATVVIDGSLPKADSSTYPGGVGYKYVSLTDLTSDSSLLGVYSFDATSYKLTISNVADPNNVKHVWLRMNYTVGHDFPQNSGDIFNPALWPSLTAGGSVVVTGASVTNEGFGHSVYMTWDITPQPNSETINLNFPALAGDFGGVFQVEASTICTPEPSTTLLMGLGIIAIGYAQRRKIQTVA
jgi:hypothetical protein